MISGLANYHITDGLLDIHGRIKSERTKDLDDDDMTDEDRKDDILGGNMHHILSNGYSLKSEIKSSDCGVPLPPSKPKIWSLADTAACKTPPPPPPSQGGQWLGSSNGFALPSSRCVPPIPKNQKPFTVTSVVHCRYSTGSGFLPSHCQQGFPEVQTDTPPQTPPNMKVPNISGNVAPGQGAPCIGTNTNQGGYAGQNSGFLGGFGRMNSPQRSQQSAQNPMSGPGGAVGDNAAFKPFYKR